MIFEYWECVHSSTHSCKFTMSCTKFQKPRASVHHGVHTPVYTHECTHQRTHSVHTSVHTPVYRLCTHTHLTFRPLYMTAAKYKIE